MGWRNCQASLTFAAGVNARWPGRDRTSDGTIGNAEHATRDSDHNAWVIVAGVGVVRARDTDVDGIDAAWCVEELRKLGAAGDPRLTGGGYAIYNRRITKPDWSGWAVYTGANAHDHHFHLSYSRNAAGFDSPAPWAFLGGPAVPLAPVMASSAGSPDAMRTLAYGMRNDPDVADLQRFLNAYNWVPPLPLLPVTGNYLDQTAQVIYAAGQQMGLGSADRDGRNVGPRFKAAFWARGARW